MESGDRERVVGLNRHRFAPVGDLDTEEVDSLRVAMLQAIGSEPAHVTLDASNAGFTGAAFLGLLAELRQRIEAAGGRLAVRGANPATERIMLLCDMGHLLVEDADEAPGTIVLPQQDSSLTGHSQNLK
jgi:anti-anti-sigma factor